METVKPTADYFKCKCVLPSDQLGSDIGSIHRAPIDCRDEAYWLDLRERHIKLRDETEAAPAGQTVYTLLWDGDVDCGGRNGYVGTYAAQSLAARAAYNLLPRGVDKTEWYNEHRERVNIVLALDPHDGERTTLMVVESEVEGE